MSLTAGEERLRLPPLRKLRQDGPRCEDEALPCAGERIKWAYKVDIGAPGTPRELRSASGFATKREALEAMARL